MTRARHLEGRNDIETWPKMKRLLRGQFLSSNFEKLMERRQKKNASRIWTGSALKQDHSYVHQFGDQAARTRFNIYTMDDLPCYVKGHALHCSNDDNNNDYGEEEINIDTNLSASVDVTIEGRNRNINQVEFDEEGKVCGVTSEGETARCKKLVCEPSNLPNRVRKVGKVARAIAFMSHPIPSTNDNHSMQVILPQTQLGRKFDMYLLCCYYTHNVIPRGEFTAFVSTEAEMDRPDMELKPEIDLLGLVDKQIFDTYDRCETVNEPSPDNYFISTSYDATTHFESTVRDVLNMYRMILLGVDDMDIFKEISLKLLAMEHFLVQHPEWRGKGYFDLPFCSPDPVKDKLEALGEVLNGDRLVDAPYKLDFRVGHESTSVCQKHLTKEDVAKFKSAVDKEYYFQRYYDDLPIWGFIGKVNEDGSDHIDNNSMVDITEDKEINVEFLYLTKWRMVSAGRIKLRTFSLQVVHEVQIGTCLLYYTTKRINETFGRPGYKSIILIDSSLQLYDRIAYYIIVECCLVTAIRDGKDLIPYEYVICRQGNETLDKLVQFDALESKMSMFVVSEFIGCSQSLSGACVYFYETLYIQDQLQFDTYAEVVSFSRQNWVFDPGGYISLIMARQNNHDF